MILVVFSIIRDTAYGITPWFALSLAVLGLFLSAYISSSETAFFSLTPKDKEKLAENDDMRSKQVLSLLENPNRLLATILITNNFVNIVITLLLAFFTSQVFDFWGHQWLEFLIETVVITFLLLLVSEITPKVYATLSPVRVSRFAAPGLTVLSVLLKPFSLLLIKSTSIVEQSVEHSSHHVPTMDELSQAVELTHVESEEEKEILEGITKFGNIEVSDIMRPRLDIVAVDIKSDFKQLLHVITDSGYSRIPVYAGSTDNIKGILFAKDLIAHLDKPRNFRWQTLVRPAYFVPESKKLDDLFTEFQEQKIHLAIVVDEYGGTAGLVTLEDVLEEIVGDIADEYDEDERLFTQINDTEYLFDGKILLNDFYKVLDVDEDDFEKIDGEVETLAGLVLELKGDFPKKGEKLEYKNYIFEVVSVTRKRIKTIKVKIKSNA
ncbi:MAG: gliding motility-associated protein GldE [Paludibacteraceae bacterium]|nr:gliding motility-associated protein GldE [Paludibacteraceae bacterium]